MDDLFPIEKLPQFGRFRSAPRIELHVFHGKVERDRPPKARPSLEFDGRVALTHVHVLREPERISILRNGERIAFSELDKPDRVPGFENAPRVALFESAGGLPGLYVVMKCGFDLAIGLSALTDASDEARAYDPRVRRYGRLIAAACDGWWPDMKQIHREHGLAGEVHLCFPSGHKADSYQAGRMAGFEGVTLHPMDASHHSLRKGRPILTVAHHLLDIPQSASSAA